VSGLSAPVLKVGVFRNQPLEDVCRAARVAGLDAVQLHGAEDPVAYTGRGFEVIKAVAVEGGTFPEEAWRIAPDVTVLLDAFDPVRGGGTGRTIDWHAAAAVSARRRVILSGGLRPENVGRAIGVVAPWAVDVSSGVEQAPGVKAPRLLRALFDAVASEDGRRGTDGPEDDQP
jgi:phosphoribosylanthranilate isomerase